MSEEFNTKLSRAIRQVSNKLPSANLNCEKLFIGRTKSLYEMYLAMLPNAVTAKTCILNEANSDNSIQNSIQHRHSLY